MPPRLMRSLLLVVMAFARYGQAGLEWTNRDMELRADAGKDEMVATFEFRNSGDYAVSIVSTSSSCGCTSVSKNKLSYKPGEKGEVVAAFDLKNKTGTLYKVIFVTTDDPASPQVLLKCTVVIPELYTMDTASICWTLSGNELPTRTIRLQRVAAAGDKPVKIVGARCSSDKFTAELKVIKEAETYELAVTPLTRESKTRGLVTLDTDLMVNGVPRMLNAYLRIKK